MEAISALAAVLESRDYTTGEHIKRTQALTEAVARSLGFSACSKLQDFAPVRYPYGTGAMPNEK